MAFYQLKLKEQIILELSDYSKKDKKEIEISLEKQEIKFGNKIVKFELDAFKKDCLLNGLDDIGLTMAKIENIDNYEKNINLNKSWIFNNE